MAELTRNEYPNHWFAFDTSLSRGPIVKYTCLRCLPSLWSNSNFRFDLWKWNGVHVTNTFDLFNLVRESEKSIVTLFWLDYYHIPIWKRHYDKRLSYGPRHVLEDMSPGKAPLVPSDIFAPIILGWNLTFLEYLEMHSFYRQTQLGGWQDIQISGAAYIVQQDDVGGELGPEEMGDRNFHLVFSGGPEFRFLTCSSISRSRISFFFYFDPFKCDTWGVIGAFLVVLPTVVLALSWLTGQKSIKCRLAFLYSAFFLSIIEMQLSQPKSLKRNTIFALFFLVWCACSVIISNA